MLQVIKTYESAECNTFDVVVNDQVVAYYYEHFTNPESGEKLADPVFEIYYELNEDGDFDASLVTEDFDEIDEVIAIVAADLA